MTDKNNQYGTQFDPEYTEPSTRQNISESTTTGTVTIDVNGKKLEVVSVKEYNKLLTDFKAVQKQVKILKTEIQNLTKFVNGVAKTASQAQISADKINDRFN
jgi:uncharacterized protein YlxW (UPF0749 family)